MTTPGASIVLAWLDTLGTGLLVPRPDTVPTEALLAVHRGGVVAGRRVALSASAWRDFMAGGDDALVVATTIEVTEDGDLPRGLFVDRTVVLHTSGAWVVLPVEDSSARTGERLLTLARQGPRWPSDTLVDVIVRLRAAQGAMSVLRHAAVPIKYVS